MGGGFKQFLLFCANYWLQLKILHYQNCIIFYFGQLIHITFFVGAKGDWDFRICDLAKNPDGTDI